MGYQNASQQEKAMQFRYSPKFRENINGLIYKSIEAELEISECFKLYENSFLQDEPIAKNFLDMKTQTTANLKSRFEKHKKALKDGVSLMVVDPQAGNRVVGIRISSVVERDDPKTSADLSTFSYFTQLLSHFLGQVGSPKEVFELYPDITRIYNMVL